MDYDINEVIYHTFDKEFMAMINSCVFVPFLHPDVP
jgi:hypothetical protein